MIQTKKSIERISVWFVTGNLPPYFSGAGRNDLLLALYCVKYGLNVTLVTELHKGDKRESIIDGVSVKRIRMGTDHSLIWRILGPFNMLKSLITGTKPDIVRFRGFSFRIGLMIFLIKTFFNKIKIIVQPAMFGGDDAFTIKRKPFGFFLFRQMLKSDSIFAMNELIKESFIAFGYSKYRIYSVNNPIDLKRFNPLSKNAKNNLRDQLGFDRGAIIFITSGILSKRKKQTFITEAFKQLLQKNYKDNVLLIHMGPKASDLVSLEQPDAANEALIEEELIKKIPCSTNISEKVLIIGNQVNPERWLQAADCFIHASIFEGEANVINEAMATGLTCIVPDNRLYYEKIPKKIKFHGFIENDIESLVNVLEEITLNPNNEILNPIYVRKAILEKKDANRIAIQYCDSILSC